MVQPYRKKTKGLVRTVLQTFAIQAENESKPVTKMKQRTAFPPNYIHSLDSSHMMLTAIGCHEAGARTTRFALLVLPCPPSAF